MLERDMILSNVSRAYRKYVWLIFFVHAIFYTPLVILGLLYSNKIVTILGVFIFVWMIERIRESKTLYYSLIVDGLTEHGMTAVSILHFMKPKLSRKNFFKFKNYCLIRRGLNEKKRNKQCDCTVEQESIPKE